MKKVSVYVMSKKFKPSNYYRVIQYLEKYPEVDIHYNVSPFIFALILRFKRNKTIRKLIRKYYIKSNIRRLKRSLKKDLKNKPEYVIVQKSMTKYNVKPIIREMQEELYKNTNLIWDFDDNIIEGKEIIEDEYKLNCKYAKKIIITSEFLKDCLPDECKNRIIYLPTTDMEMPINSKELGRYNEKRLKIMEKNINIVWVATSSSLVHLESIIDVLDETARYIKDTLNKQLVLKVICDLKLNRKVKYLKIVNIKWTRKKAISEIRKASIGIMPLNDNEYTRGKGGFKLIQYISTGLPVIASDVGYNNTVFKNDIGFLVEDRDNKLLWKDAIYELVENKEKWEKCSKNAYDVWKNYFNCEYNINMWKILISHREVDLYDE